jgi:hypothetical protein
MKSLDRPLSVLTMRLRLCAKDTALQAKLLPLSSDHPVHNARPHRPTSLPEPPTHIRHYVRDRSPKVEGSIPSGPTCRFVKWMLTIRKIAYVC